ncbi:hypothetical protein, partial [Shigella boydii]|uniref:hypothetical protein n=3 Tax=Shigella boydii TaxID=621 RepID=UPI001C0A6E7B
TGGTADRNRSHWSTSKTPSYTKSVSWQHHLAGARFYQKINTGKFPLTYAHNQSTKNVFVSGSKVLKL